MTSCIVFNHHSLPFDVSEDADKCIPDFLKICVMSQNIGLSTILVDESVDKDWFRMELADHYYWQEWHRKNQNNENKDLIRAFRSVVTRQPFFNSEEIDDGADLFDVSFENDPSFSALRAAAWHEAPLTSFPTRRPWTMSSLPVDVETLDQSGTLSLSRINILNIYSLDGFERETHRLQKQRNALITSGKTLLAQSSEIFAHLTFCGNSQQQLNSWSASKTVLDQVKESLTALNHFCEKWKDGVYPIYRAECLREVGLNHKVSGESETVLRTPRLRSEREFWLPEGHREVFENHVKLTHGFRLHFFPANNKKHIYIGHIGPHLRLK
ncbi:hypothetical protein [Desulfoluna sp.]|uniref:hypothetical protein n=1 Tax=Desulfoluna sp. TaxID=2045199 RepID=UPI00262533FA|nr:hypothetical protein [Desulfoluna sp.]